jgi:hypothetical protein
VKLLNRDYLNHSIELLKQLSIKTCNLEKYYTLIKEHLFYVPKKHIKRVERGLKRVKDKEESFKSKLYKVIVSI